MIQPPPGAAADLHAREAQRQHLQGEALSGEARLQAFLGGRSGEVSVNQTAK